MELGQGKVILDGFEDVLDSLPKKLLMIQIQNKPISDSHANPINNQSRLPERDTSTARTNELYGVSIVSQSQ